MPVGEHARITYDRNRISSRLFIILYLKSGSHDYITIVLDSGQISSPCTDVIKLTLHGNFHLFSAQCPYILYSSFLFKNFHLYNCRLYTNFGYCISGTCLRITKLKDSLLRIRPNDTTENQHHN